MSARRLELPLVQSYEIEHMVPSVAFECPSCSREVNLDEIVEDEGNISCVKCS